MEEPELHDGGDSSVQLQRSDHEVARSAPPKTGADSEIAVREVIHHDEASMLHRLTQESVSRNEPLRHGGALRYAVGRCSMKPAPVVDEDGAGLRSEVFGETMQQVFAQPVHRLLPRHPFAEQRLAHPHPLFLARGEPAADEMRAEGPQRPSRHDPGPAIDQGHERVGAQGTDE